ncbi:MAG: hypothetical protein HQ522_22245 [Bacteroidetes bacterium]|nr:hypothetical protein [Bacteroidota bacterium]
MNKKLYSIILLVSFFMYGCAPSSSLYKPVNGKKSFVCSYISAVEIIKDYDCPTIYEKYDEFQKTYFYYHTGISGFINLYIGKNKINKWYRIGFFYEGENWLFFKNIIIINDSGDRVVFDIKQYEKDKDVDKGGKGVKEKIDMILTNEKAKELKKLLSKGSVRIRFTGKGIIEEDFSSRLVEALSEIMEFYENLSEKEWG